MFASLLRNLARRFSPSSRSARSTAARRQALCRPGVEVLEGRLLLSTCVWDGGVDGSGTPWSDTNWSSPQNWVGDVAPVAGDDLQFPAGSLQLTANNDFPAGTVFNSIAISGIGYSIGGNALALNAGITTSNASGTDTIGMSLTLTGAETITSGTAGTDLVISSPTVNNGGYRLTIGGSGDVYFNGGSIAGPGGLTRNGTGQLFLANTSPNTYQGTTTVSKGTLNLWAPAGTAIPGALTVGSGTSGSVAATVLFSNFNQIPTTTPITINGTGLLNLNGYDATLGPLTLQAGRISTGAGLLTLNGDVTTLPADARAVISGHINLGTGIAARNFTLGYGTADADLDIKATIAGDASVQLVKQGTGFLLLQGANTYAGQTLVNAGTLWIDRATALGATTAGTTVAAGASLYLENPTENSTLTFAAEPLTLNGTGDPDLVGSGALQGDGDCATLVWPGQVTLASPSVVMENSSTTLNITGLVTGPGDLTKTGSGEVMLSHANSYTGATVVKSGILDADNASSLGATGPGSGTTVTGSGTLQLEGGLTFAAEPLTLRGTGSGGSSGGVSALHSVGNNTWTGSIYLAATSQVNVTDANTLTITGVIDGPTGNNLVVGRSIANWDDGTVLLTAANTYAGTTTVAVGTLAIRNATALGSPASGTNGGTTVLAEATLELRGGLTFDPTEALTLNDLGSSTDISPLQNRSGNNTWAGTINLATSSSIGAASGTTLTITGVISGPSTSLFEKLGTGVVVLAVGNTYAGSTVVAAGTLVVQDPAALGATTAGTSVKDCATLQLEGGFVFNPERLTLRGAGVNDSAGALRNRSGANTWTGPITLGSAATIRADAGTSLTLAPPTAQTLGASVANGGYLLTVNSIGSVTFGYTISGAGGLTKNGAGTVTLAGNSPNTFGGTTTINAGTLVLAMATGIPAIGGGLVINPNGTLTGSGIIYGSVTNSGTINVLGSGLTGTIAINGNYTQTGTGVLNVDVGGTASGQFDQLAIAGTASLAGTLNVALVGGFTPVSGNVFQILTFASSSGTFTTVNGLGSLTLAYDSSDVSLLA
jgi:autotransporter-associated beta strand protein